MCMIDFGCYTNHSLGMNTAADYNNSHCDKGRRFTFICDRYSIGSFPEIDALSRGMGNHLRCGLEIDAIHNKETIPVKCIAISDKGVENLSRIVDQANGNPLCIERLNDIRDGILLGFSGGYDIPQIRGCADFWYLTPSLSRQVCIDLYEATQRDDRLLCAATNACYTNKSDEYRYRLSQQHETDGYFKNRSMPNHMLSEREMFERLSFLGHQAARKILIDNPFKLLDPYWEYLNRDFSWQTVIPPS